MIELKQLLSENEEISIEVRKENQGKFKDYCLDQNCYWENDVFNENKYRINSYKKVSPVIGFCSQLSASSLVTYQFENLMADLTIPAISGMVTIPQENLKKEIYLPEICYGLIVSPLLKRNEIVFLMNAIKERKYTYFPDIYFLGNYQQSQFLSACLKEIDLSKKMKVYYYGLDSQDNQIYLEDSKGNKIERWIYNDQNFPTILPDHQFKDQLLIPGFCEVSLLQKSLSKMPSVYSCNINGEMGILILEQKEHFEKIMDSLKKLNVEKVILRQIGRTVKEYSDTIYYLRENKQEACICCTTVSDIQKLNL